MSTILKALRRLQEERSRGEGSDESLREDVVLAPEPPPHRRGRWLAGIAAGVASFALVLVGLALWEPGGGDPGPGPEGPGSQPGALAAVTPEPTPSATPRPTATPEPTPSATPRPTATPEPTPSPTPRPTATPEPTPEPTPSPTPRPSATPEPTPSATPHPTATPEPTPSPTPRPRATPAVSRPREVPLEVQRIQWHPDAARRRAWVRVQGEGEPRELAEGDRVGAYRVDTIEPAAVLFSDGAVEIRRRIGVR